MSDTTRFSFFPNPAEGETVYSWLSRFHLMSGNRSFRTNTLPMLGVVEGRPANEFPSYLSALAVASNTPLEKIITNMTPYRYHATFLSEPIRLHLWESLVLGQTDSLQSSLGMVANRMTPGKFLYCCRHCMKEDIDNHGFPFWHLEHQLKGVVVCGRHHEHLHPVSRLKKTTILPEPVEEELSTAMEERFATLIHDEQSSSRDFISKKQSMIAYKARMADLGLLTEAGRVRMRQLKKLVNSHIAGIPIGFREFDFVRQQVDKSRYPECLFYLPHVNHHPLKHMVLIECLFENWSDFLNEVRSDKTNIIPSHNDIRLIKPQAILSGTARGRLKAGESLRSVSHSEGLSVTTLKILAQQVGITVDCRPSKIFQHIERAIQQQLVLGEKTMDVALRFNVSVGAVEQILRKHPELVELRKCIWFYQNQRQYRQAILHHIVGNPETTRKLIRESVGASFMWLYKHDKAWLHEHLPAPKPYRK